MDAFAWSVVGSVAGVVGAAAAVVFGLLPLLRDRQARREIPALAAAADGAPVAAGGEVAPVVVGEIPQEPVAFQPRAGLLAGMEGGGPSGRVAVVRAVTGMRGVGKTQLAAEYARARLAARWRLVAWTNAETADELLAGLAETAAALGLGAGDRETAGLAVRHWLELDGERCLLVFDNVTDPAALRPFLPAAGAAQVIITSNERSVDELGAGVPLDVFTEQEALAYLAERTGLGDAAGARELAAELGCLPLALAQAAAVIAGQRLDYPAYLRRARALPVAQLLRPAAAGQYPRGVASAVLLSVETVRAADDTGAAVAVLGLLAVLSPAGVRRSMIYEAGRRGDLGRQGETEEATDRALARLAGASLVTFSVDGTSVAAHRLVMRVTREQAEVRGELAEACAAAGGLLDDLSGSLKETWHEDRAAVRNLVEHIVALYNAAAGHRDEAGLASLLIRLRWWAITFLGYLDDSTTQATGIAETMLADQERVLGVDHPDTLATRTNLGESYRVEGRTAEAVALHERALSDMERVVGADHHLALFTRTNLAIAYGQTGRPAEAVALYERALSDMERVLGADHPHTLATRSNLAIAYRDVGRTAEAIALQERTLADMERVLGADHPHTVRTRSGLANTYRAAGRTAEAADLGPVGRQTDSLGLAQDEDRTPEEPNSGGLSRSAVRSTTEHRTLDSSKDSIRKRGRTRLRSSRIPRA